jgi:hypothetical protein
VSGMEADPRSPGAKTLGKPCGDGLLVSRLLTGISDQASFLTQCSWWCREN